MSISSILLKKFMKKELEKSKENFEKIGKTKFSNKNFDAISFGNVNYSKFSKRVLDIGCGEGVIVKYLASSLNCEIDGIDIDKGKVHRANKKFKLKLVKGKTLCHNLYSKDIDRKFKRNTFDVVVIIHTLHHLSNIFEVLLKTKHVLKKGGKLYVGEYEKNYGENLDNCPRFSSKKIKSMLKTAGFKSIKKFNIHKNFIIIRCLK